MDKELLMQWQKNITRIPEWKNDNPKGCGVDGCHECRIAIPGADPHCVICHGQGYVHPLLPEGKPNYLRLVSCEAKGCFADYLHGVQAATVFDKLTGVNRTKTFDRFLSISGAEECLALAKEISREMPDFSFLTMYGSNGCGKTHLAHAIANVWLGRAFRVKFYSAAGLLNKYKMGIEDNQPNNHMLNDLANIDALLIDDLAAEYFKSWSQEIWEYLIDQRYMKVLSTVITTNNQIDQFPPRILSRLSDKEISRRVHNKAVDYRITQGKMAVKKNV